MSDGEHSENSSYYERLLEEELANIEFDPDEDGYDGGLGRDADPFNQS